ncbi:transposase [Streptomyces sp. NPDC096132]|uniref:transposase n=1 Tax=Streptomyces sp. NPDC096132 TaxID=3366075 RepID=UPI00381B9042
MGGRAHDGLAGRLPTSAAGHGQDPPAEVDEFAFRKGCTYGTVLVGVEAGRVVDVLPDRAWEPFAAWLKQHPDAEIICRDWATANTKAIKEAAPNAPRRRRSLAPASEPVRGGGEDLSPATQLPAQTRRAGGGAKRAPELPRTQIIEPTRHRFGDIRRKHLATLRAGTAEPVRADIPSRTLVNSTISVTKLRTEPISKALIIR